MDKKQMLSNLVDISNKFFRGRKNKAFIAERQNIHTTSKYKKACNFGKLYYLLPTTAFEMSLEIQLIQTAEHLQSIQII